MKTFDKIKISFTLDSSAEGRLQDFPQPHHAHPGRPGDRNLRIDYIFLYDSDKPTTLLNPRTGRTVTRGDLISADKLAQGILVDLYRNFHMDYIKVEKSVKKKSYKRIPKKYQLI